MNATESIKCGDCGIEAAIPVRCEVCGRPFAVTTGKNGEVRLSCSHVSTEGEAMAKEPKEPQAASTRDTVPGFGAAVRARRTARGLSLEFLAHKAGTHQTTISKIENGQRAPSLLLARKLAAALGIGVDTLLKEADELAE